MLNNFENNLAKNKEIVILGDLNINYILDKKLCENQAHFIGTLLCCKQLIVEPTRVTQSSQSVIDHIYTTMPHNHLDHGILKYALSDHYFIFTTLKFRRQASPPKRIHKKDYNGININDFIRGLMDIGLYSGVIDAKSTSDAWRDWSNAFNTVVSKHVKIKEIRVKDRLNPLYINVIILTAWHGRISSSDKMNEYKKLRNLVISTIRNSQRSYYKKTITTNKSCDVW